MNLSPLVCLFITYVIAGVSRLKQNGGVFLWSHAILLSYAVNRGAYSSLFVMQHSFIVQKMHGFENPGNERYQQHQKRRIPSIFFKNRIKTNPLTVIVRNRLVQTIALLRSRRN